MDGVAGAPRTHKITLTRPDGALVTVESRRLSIDGGEQLGGRPSAVTGSTRPLWRIRVWRR